MRQIRFDNDVWTFRWPWRVTPLDPGFAARLPWWGRPYRWLAALLGFTLVHVERVKR